MARESRALLGGDTVPGMASSDTALRQRSGREGCKCLIKDRTDIWGSTGSEQLLSVFSCVCNNPKIHCCDLPWWLCLTVQGEFPESRKVTFWVFLSFVKMQV